MRRGSTGSTVILALGILMWPAGVALAQHLGMVVDDARRNVVVFDTRTDGVIGLVPMDEAEGVTGDCAIAPDEHFGFITDFAGRLWIIDLTKTPPELASGVNPIPISNPGEDVVVTPDGRFTLVCDGGANAPISVVDPVTRISRG